MDGDFSHNPADIPGLLKELNSADLVIGSRYKNGVRVLNWAPHRLVLSLAAARYVRATTGMPLADPTSGYRCFRSESLKMAFEVPARSSGYVFHVDTAYRFYVRGLKIAERPIIFT